MKTTASIVLVALMSAASPALAAMALSSTDIREGAAIPTAHIYPRCGGQNQSPQLSWTGVPAGTASLTLTMIDTDVKPAQWSHWIVVDIPPDTTTLAAGASALPGKARAVPSNFGDPFYDGPCPPTGSGVHHYEITMWALPAGGVSIVPGEKATDVSAALSKVALGKASLTGWVKR